MSIVQRLKTHLICIATLCGAGAAGAMGLMAEPASPQCGAPVVAPPAPPAAAKYRLSRSLAVPGSKDIAWVWLGTPTARYPHTSLGSPVHAATLHVLLAASGGPAKEVVYKLPAHRVFEDLVPRLVDLDNDGRDEIVVVESDVSLGSALVVLGLHGNVLKEVARSPFAGLPYRWLNPVGVADFDGDGKLDLASVITPHVGGVLTLYHFRPPKLEPFAKAMDVSNHVMHAQEQQLSVIVEQPGMRPTIIVPDMGLKALHALRWESGDRAGTPGRWKELADVMPLPSRVERIAAVPGGGCALLTDGTWWRMQVVP